MADSVVFRAAVLVNGAYFGNFFFRSIKINIALKIGGLRNMDIVAFPLAHHFEVESSSMRTVARMGPH